MAYTFKSHLSVNDIYVYAYDSNGNWIEEFVGNPNQSMMEFRNIMLTDVRSWLKWRGNLSSVIDDAVMEVSFLLSAIVHDAAKSGTWMSVDELWHQEVWRVVNMANAVRAA